MKARKVRGPRPAGTLADNAERIVRSRLDELCASCRRSPTRAGRGAARHADRRQAAALRARGDGRACFGPYAKTAAKRAKDLQDLLGEIHDCDVQIPRVAASSTMLRDADAEELRRRAGDADDLDPALAPAPHAASARRRRARDLPARAPRSLLYDRFLALWRDSSARASGRGSSTRSANARGANRGRRVRATTGEPRCRWCRRPPRTQSCRPPRRVPRPASRTGRPTHDRSRRQRHAREPRPRSYSLDLATRAVLQPRALVAGLQRPRAAARRGRAGRCSSASSSARSTRRTSTSSSWSASPACTTRSTPGSTRRARTGARPSETIDAHRASAMRSRSSARRGCRARDPAAGARRARDPHRRRSTTLDRASAETLTERFQRQVFPVADAARGRPRPALPVHLEPVAVASPCWCAIRRPSRAFARVKVPKEMLPRFIPVGGRAHVRAAGGR